MHIYFDHQTKKWYFKMGQLVVKVEDKEAWEDRDSLVAALRKKKYRVNRNNNKVWSIN